MKVAILTQPLHTNYGGTLQAFALQQVLKNAGCDLVTINYRKVPPRIHPLRAILSFVKNKVLGRDYFYSFTSHDILEISKHHRRFIEDNISYTKPIYSFQSLKEFFITENFDAVIVGSDQTWRPRYSPRIDSFFLDFLIENKHIKKISYASSFGTDNWEFSTEQTSKFSDLLHYFDSVSVREISAVSLCEKYFGVSPAHVLDPTLLISKDFYLKLIANTQSNGLQKVLNYVLDDNKDKREIINFTCMHLGKECFDIYPKHTKKKKFIIKNYSDYIYPPIEQWIRSFYDSDFVITDSFHGTVFSIIFNKPFIAIANEGRGKARFISLLGMLGLENRLISHVDEIDCNLLNEEINYDEVNIKLNRLRTLSHLFLRNSLSIGSEKK